MPDFPRSQVGVAFPAFQTPSGLLPQAVREHQSDYAETQGQAQVLARRTDGVWTDLPYSPSRYHTDAAPAVWTVAKADVVAARYRVVGATLEFNLYIFGAVSVAPANVLIVEFPERLRARQYAIAPAFLAGSVYGTNICQAPAGARALSFYYVGFTPWPVGPVRVAAQISIEVEEV